MHRIVMKAMAGTKAAASHVVLAVAMLLLGAGLLGADIALAAGLGQPVLYGVNLQEAATPIMEFLRWFHNYVTVIITVITLFVMALLVIVLVRFNEKANSVPSKTTHHVGLEVAWTVLPILILVFIAIPSFRLLLQEQSPPKADLTLKITGKQWFWTFEYPDHGKFSIDQIMLTDKEIADAVASGKAKAGELPRLLAVDNEILVPLGKVVHINVTAADVLHSFAVPSFGVKIDAVPGRLNHSWFKPEKEGIYYGQCSELCGKDHAFMPLAIRVVSEARFNEWLEVAKKKFATNDAPRPAYAQAEAGTVSK